MWPSRYSFRSVDAAHYADFRPESKRFFSREAGVGTEGRRGSIQAFGRPECKRELTWMQSRVWRHFPVPSNPPSKGRPPARFRPRTPSRAKKVAR